MRAIVVALFISCIASVGCGKKGKSAAPGADGDKAKDATNAFLNAMKAKDIDALMKTVDAPFMIEMGPSRGRTIDTIPELKEAMTNLLKEVVPEKVMAIEVGTAYDMAAMATYIKEEVRKEKADEKIADQIIDQAEKLVGKSGYMVMLLPNDGHKIPYLLVRFKDGKASVASMPK